MNLHYQIIPTAPAYLFFLCLLVLSFCATRNVGKPVVAHHKNIICIDHERDALLNFKNTVFDDCELMSSWRNSSTSDCCTWKGVSCSNQSGHVIGLHLSGTPYHSGCLYSSVISPSLGELKFLKYLDLSSNDFHGMDIPSSIGSLVNLIHLNLSDSDFSANIPHQLENLTRLTSLDLSFSDGFHAKSLNSLSRLTLLREIILDGTNLSKVKNWSQSIGSLPLLEVLKMDQCELSEPRPSSSLLSANLRIVSLSQNKFTSSAIFQWLFNTRNYSSPKQSLQYLDLSYNLIQGPIPDAIGNSKLLKYLDLSKNSLSSIPDAIGNLKLLEHLDLSQNSLSSKIPDAIGNLQVLMHMDLSSNSLSGPIPSSLGSLGSLSYFNLSYNRLEGSIPRAIGDLYTIYQIDLSSNQLQGFIPTSLGTLSSLSYLNLTNNHLNGTIPASISGLGSLIYLDLSSNLLQGFIPSSLGRLSSLSYLNFSNNHLNGNIPASISGSRSLIYLDLSSNQLQGFIPSSLGSLSSLSYLNLSSNHLNGTIPASISGLGSLKYLDLSSNNLSGDIPCNLRCWYIPAYLNFSYNNLSGSIPECLSIFGFKAFQGNPSLTDKFQNTCKVESSLSIEGQAGGEDNEDDKIYPGLYVSIGLGIYTGFWVFCGTLTLKKSWRTAYFRFLDHIIDKIYVVVAVYLAKFRRNSQV